MLNRTLQCYPQVGEKVVAISCERVQCRRNSGIDIDRRSYWRAEFRQCVKVCKYFREVLARIQMARMPGPIKESACRDFRRAHAVEIDDWGREITEPFDGRAGIGGHAGYTPMRHEHAAIGCGSTGLKEAIGLAAQFTAAYGIGDGARCEEAFENVVLVE